MSAGVLRVEMIMVTYSQAGKNITRQDLEDAIKAIQADHPNWGMKDVSVSSDGKSIVAPGTHHMKAKVREIYEKAEEISEARLGVKTFTVSIALDARVDVKIKASSLKEAMSKANAEEYWYKLADAEVIGTKPVNISDENGDLLADF